MSKQACHLALRPASTGQPTAEAQPSRGAWVASVPGPVPVLRSCRTCCGASEPSRALPSSTTVKCPRSVTLRGHFGWWARTGSNRRHLLCKSSALPLSYAPVDEATDYMADRRCRQSGSVGREGHVVRGGSGACRGHGFGPWGRGWSWARDRGLLVGRAGDSPTSIR